MQFQAARKTIRIELIIGAASQFELSPPPSDGVTAVTFAPNDSSRLLVASWDRQVYYYKVEDSSSGNSLIQKYDNRAPILDLCFGSDENEAFLAGVDQSVSRYSFALPEFRCFDNALINLED